MAEQIIIEFIADTSRFEEAYNKVTTQISEANGLNKDGVSAFQKVNADAAASFNVVTDAAKQLNDQLRNINGTISGGVIKSTVGTLNLVSDALSKTAAAAKSLSGQFTETGKRGAQALADQRKEVEILCQAFDELKLHLVGLNKDTETLSKLVTLGKDATHDFENASGTLKAYDSKNGELEKTIIRLQTAQKVLNGAMEAAKAIQSDSPLMSGLLKAKTEALTAAKWLEVEATTAEKVATAGWVGVAIAGITAIGYAIYNLISKEKEHEREQLNFENSLTRQNGELEHQIALYNQIGRSVLDLEMQQSKLAIGHAQAAQKQIIDKNNVTSEKYLNNDEKKKWDEQQQIVDKGQNKIKELTEKGAAEIEQIKRESDERNIKNTESGLHTSSFEMTNGTDR